MIIKQVWTDISKPDEHHLAMPMNVSMSMDIAPNPN
jgi:hypothetical protein